MTILKKKFLRTQEDSAGSESLFYTWKNQSQQTDPITPELETDSLQLIGYKLPSIYSRKMWKSFLNLTPVTF